MSNKSDKKPAGEFEQLREMNEKLLISSVRQHELTEKAEEVRETLRISEDKFRRAIEEAPIPVIMHAEDGEVLQISRSWTELTGYTLEDKDVIHSWLTEAYGYGGEEVRGAMIHSFLPPLDATDALHSVQFDITTRQGERRSWSFNASVPGLLADGRRFVVGMVEDITKRIRTEDALREINQRFSAIYEFAPVGIVEASPDGKYRDGNKQFCLITGYSKNELSQLGIGETSDPRDFPLDNELHRRLVAGEIPSYDIEKRYLRKDGSTVWCSLFRSAVRDEDGKTLFTIGAVTDITLRKQAEEGLRENENRLRTMADSIPQLAWMAEPDGFIFWYNSKWYEYTGTTPEQMEGWGWQSVHDPKILPKVLVRWKGSISTGEPFEMEFPILGADGVVRWFLTRVNPLRDHDGKIVRWFGTNTDIDESRRIREALRESEERFVKAFNASPLSITITALKTGKLVEVNDTFVAITGYSRSEAVGRTTAELGLWEDTAHREAELEMVASAGSLRQNEYRFRMKDGSEIIGLLSAEFIEIGGEHCALTVIQDITERSKAEGALRESEEKFRILSEAAPALIWFDDPDGNCVYVNQQYLDFAGKTLDELEGKGWHLFLHPEDEPAYVADFRDARRERRPFHHRARALRRDGAWRWIESFARPLFGSDGTFLGHVGVSPDISATVEAEIILHRDRQNLEMLVAERTAELADANENRKAEAAQRLLAEKERVRLLNQIVTTQEDERRRLARDLHDEMGQQLTALRLKLESAKAMCDDQAVCDEIDDIQKIAGRLDTDVSFLARELHPAKLDELGLAAALAAYVKEWARFSDVVAEFHAADLIRERFSPEIETNLYRIAQEALNNTRKHSKAKNISVLLEKRSDGIILIIEDDGVAFDTEAKLKRSKGLGLIGMHERAALLGGTLEIESSHGSGTTIFVRVPSEPPAVAGG